MNRTACGLLLCCATVGLMLLGAESRAAAQEGQAKGTAEPGRAMRVKRKRPSVVPNQRERAAPEQDEAVERKRPISLGILLGYGMILGDSPVNPWGVGFGARGGYNLGSVFLGARFAFYVGEEPSSVWEIGLEAGYDLRAGIFTARPGAGVGLASLSLEATPTSMESETEVYVAPGLTLLLDVAPDIFLGADARVQLLFAEPRRDALIVLGNVGMRF